MIPEKFEIDGVGYVVDAWGVIHQTSLEVGQKYDRDYVRARYDTLPDRGRQMSMLRIGYLVGTLRCFQNVLDVGYGNGDFLAALRLWRAWHVQGWGLDVSGYPLPEGCQEACEEDLCGKSWDLVTFFDSLEHIPDLGFIRTLDARFVALTLPFCHADRLGIDWFKDWKHRRPGEHLHHFSLDSLTKFMRSRSFELISSQALEDAIRIPEGLIQNTFTAVYRQC